MDLKLLIPFEMKVHTMGFAKPTVNELLQG